MVHDSYNHKFSLKVESFLSSKCVLFVYEINNILTFHDSMVAR